MALCDDLRTPVSFIVVVRRPSHFSGAMVASESEAPTALSFELILYALLNSSHFSRRLNVVKLLHSRQFIGNEFQTAGPETETDFDGRVSFRTGILAREALVCRKNEFFFEEECSRWLIVGRSVG